jgi:hypothetical protein|tara:strand:+ start:1450 stop:2049 length:600 start_codon:yes stop_codon:yes gene_type:complete
MLFKLLSIVFFIFRKLTTYPDYYITSEEIEYELERDIKYQVEDKFWEDESKSWDGILDQYHVNVTGKKFRHTSIPQNVKYVILRISYSFNGHIYKAITNDINFKPGEDTDTTMSFNVPLTSAWLVDHDDKPVRDVTEKVKRYIGPRGDFHKQNVSLYHFLYYDIETLEERFPKIIVKNTLGMKKVISTINGFTTDLRRL